jgi:hypothetical protein
MLLGNEVQEQKRQDRRSLLKTITIEHFSRKERANKNIWTSRLDFHCSGCLLQFSAGLLR